MVPVSCFPFTYNLKSVWDQLINSVALCVLDLTCWRPRVLSIPVVPHASLQSLGCVTSVKTQNLFVPNWQFKKHKNKRFVYTHTHTHSKPVH